MGFKKYRAKIEMEKYQSSACSCAFTLSAISCKIQFTKV